MCMVACSNPSSLDHCALVQAGIHMNSRPILNNPEIRKKEGGEGKQKARQRRNEVKEKASQDDRIN